MTTTAVDVTTASPRSRHPRNEARNRAEPHLTIAELCEELNITRSTFYDWRAKRKAPRCFKLPNGEIRIRRADYEAWLSSLDEGVEAA